ncbi:MAG TPA: pentapeptide repeat-containing protein [Longimicrobiaceae bacterium]|nr:pentapeptide repeat-containing protein [Longimicrobiaceae bacterium]
MSFIGFSGFLAIYQLVRGNEKTFNDALTEARGRLLNSGASDASRNTAAEDLRRLPGSPEQAQRVAAVLQAFLQEHTRPAATPDSAAHRPCRNTGYVTPTYVSRALVVFGSVMRQVEGGGGIRLPDADLQGVEADTAGLEGASFPGACLRGASLNGVRMSGADLTGAVVDSASLRGSVLVGASLPDASLVGTGLDGARLAGARLTRADLTGASLVGADLTLALLAGATLDGADLSGASLACAYLEAVQLHDIQHWDEIRDFDGAYLFQAEGLPDGLRRLAVSRGAIETELSQEAWQERRSVCERRKRAAAAPRGG